MSETPADTAVGAYVPGGYMCFCTDCGGQFIGAKRCTCCRGCALRAPIPEQEGWREAIARKILGPKSHWNTNFKADRLDPKWMFYPEVARAFAKADEVLAIVGGRS